MRQIPKNLKPNGKPKPAKKTKKIRKPKGFIAQYAGHLGVRHKTGRYLCCNS